MASDVDYMTLAVAEAQKSEPVPSAYCVGAVIVKDGRVLSAGFSRELPGNTHAEECAIEKAKAAYGVNELSGSCVYTTMEPCSTRLSGKKGCAYRLLEVGVKKVVIGVEEPPNFVDCVGVKTLADGGVQVVRLKGMEDECLAPNKHVLRES